MWKNFSQYSPGNRIMRASVWASHSLIKKQQHERNLIISDCIETQGWKFSEVWVMNSLTPLWNLSLREIPCSCFLWYSIWKKKKKERAATKVNQLVLIVKFFIYQYYFICRFDEGKHKVWKSCTTYLLDQDYNSGCLFKTEGPTLAISVRNSNGSEELFSKRLKSDFYSKYEKSQLLWQF